MRVYFARPENVANTPLDQFLIRMIERHRSLAQDEIVAPLLPKKIDSFFDQRAAAGLMDQVRSCNAIVFLPFRDGMIHTRHAEKIKQFENTEALVFEISPEWGLHLLPLHSVRKERFLKKLETRDRIWDPFGTYLLSYH